MARGVRSKHNKAKCRTCAYHRIMGGGVHMICNYSCITGQTCLYKTDKGIEDRRGDDYNNCKLYRKGVALEDED